MDLFTYSTANFKTTGKMAQAVLPGQSDIPIQHPHQRHFYVITGQVDDMAIALGRMQISDVLLPQDPAHGTRAPFPDRMFFVMGYVRHVPRGWEPLDLLGLNRSRAPFYGRV